MRRGARHPSPADAPDRTVPGLAASAATPARDVRGTSATPESKLSVCEVRGHDIARRRALRAHAVLEIATAFQQAPGCATLGGASRRGKW